MPIGAVALRKLLGGYYALGHVCGRIIKLVFLGAK